MKRALLLVLLLFNWAAAEPEIPHYDEAMQAVQSGNWQEGLRLFKLGEEATENEPAARALIRYQMAVVLYDQKQFQEALTNFQLCWPVLGQSGQPNVVEMIQFRMGLTHDALNQPAEALACLEKAAASARARNHPVNLRHALYHCGRVRLQQDDYQGAQRDLDEVIELAGQAGDQAQQAKALEYLAVVYASGSHPALMEQCWRQAADLWARLGNAQRHQKALQTADSIPALVTRTTADFQARLPHTADPAARAALLFKLGRCLAYLKQPEPARDALLESAKLYAVSDPVRSAELTVEAAELETDPVRAAQLYESVLAVLPGRRLQAANMLLRAGQVERALAVCEEGLRLASDPLARAQALNVRAIILNRAGRLQESVSSLEQALRICPPEDPFLATLHNNLGESCQSQGDYQRAREAYLEAYRLSPRAVTLSNLGTVYFNLGDYPRALDCLHRSREQAASERDETQLGVILSALGLTYQFLGRDTEARELYQLSLRSRRHTGDLRGEAYTLNNLAASHQEADQDELARQNFQASLKLARQLHDELLQANLLNNLAALESDDKLALGYLESSLKLSRQLGMADLEASSLDLLAGVQNRLGQPEEALETSSRALERHRQLGNRQAEAVSLMLRGELLARRGRAQEAVEALEGSIALFEELSVGLTPASKAAFFGRNHRAYQLLIELLLQQGKTEQAFIVSERSRARAFLESLAQGRLPQTSRLPKTLVDREAALRLELRNLLAGLPGGRPMQEVKRELALVLDEVRRLSPETASLREVRVPELSAIQAALGPGRVMLEYYVPPEGPARLFIVTAQSLRAVELEADAERLTPLVATARRQLLQLDQASGPVLGELGTLLLHPAGQELAGATEVLVVPNGTLHYLPFQALELGGAPLVEKTAVAQLPSAAAWMLIRARPHARAEGVVLAALGNAPVRWGGELGSAHKLTTRADFSPLPGTLAEISKVEPLYPKRTVLREAEMTGANLARVVQGARLVHLATHGLLDSRTPLFSGLVATDTLVTVSDIMQWEMQADLTVLSACQTGLGGFQGASGDDMVSLSRAFQHAGSRSVLASLWKVSDVATAEWMAELHRALAQGRSPAQAARQACLFVRASRPAPFFWAPFVLIGAGD